MKTSTLFYVIKQGFKNIFKNKWFSLASIATISACLFLFGVCYAIVLNAQHIVKTAEEGVSVTVFFNEDLSDERIEQIGQMISGHTAVSKIEYISADKAWESFKEEYLGEYSDGFTENPLENSSNYQIYMNDVSRQAELVTFLEGIDGVRRVNKSELTANIFTGTNTIITYISIGIIVILLLVSIFLISNTVMIGIAVRKEEIAIMKYIGATDFFARSPFVIEGILIGGIGSLVPLAVIFVLYNEALSYVQTRFTNIAGLVNFLSVNEIFHYLVPTCIVLGVGIGFIGSFVTVKKHLHV